MSVRYRLQSIECTASYTSSALCASNSLIGLSTLSAVRRQKLALYIMARSPVKLTTLQPCCTSSAPRAVSSPARTSSRPCSVLATILNLSIYFISQFNGTFLFHDFTDVFKPPRGTQISQMSADYADFSYN